MAEHNQRSILPDRVINLITGPALLAIPIATIVILLVGFEFPSYKADVTASFNLVDGQKVSSYANIDGGPAHKRLYTHNYKTNAAIIAYTNHGALYESYNLKGFWYTSPDYDLYDIDNDSIAELYGITITSDDSVFVNQVEFNLRSNVSNNRFVTTIGRHNGERDCLIESLGHTDINGDEIPEYIFTITAGFTLQPRAVFAWDITNDTIFRSPFAGMAIKDVYQSLKVDLDGDGIKEIFLHTSSTDNYHAPVLYSDTASYAVVLSRDLDFYFSPVKMAGPSSRTYTFPFIARKDTMVIALTNDRRNDVHAILSTLLDKEGNEIKKRSFASNYPTIFVYLDNTIYSISSEGSNRIIGMLGENLEHKEIAEYRANFGRLFPLNIDQDPEKELIGFGMYSDIIYVIQDGFKSITGIAAPKDIHQIEDISLVSFNDDESILHLQTGNFRCYVSYGKNKFRYLQIPFYLGVYFLLFGILHVLQRIFIFRNQRRKITEDRMMTLQLQSMMNQLNPHFTFNALNTIGDSVLEGRKEEAYEYFSKLSDLIRSSMSNAFQLDKRLDEEIDFVRQYLEIEALRFKEKLSYKIQIEPGADLSVKIPKMLLHIFVENAVKHGIFHKVEPGEIYIRINPSSEGIAITITDNGIGREAASRLVTSPGKGLSILDNYLHLYKKSHGRDIHYEISDLDPDAQDPGTKVQIQVSA